MKNFKVKLLTSIIVFSYFSNANAASTTAPMQITATVDAKCNLTATNMTFPNTQPSQNPVMVSGTSTFGVDCTKDTAYSVTFNMGLYPSNTPSRRLKHASKVEYLDYSMRVGTVTMDNSAAAMITGTGQGLGTVNTQTVNADLSVPGSASTGNYSDTVTVTVSY